MPGAGCLTGPRPLCIATNATPAAPIAASTALAGSGTGDGSTVGPEGPDGTWPTQKSTSNPGSPAWRLGW